MKLIAHLLVCMTLAIGTGASLSAQKRAARPQNPAPASSLTIKSEPKAIVWIDEIRRGVTDDSGALVLNKVSAGRHTIRVRATGFKESTTPLLPQGNRVVVRLVRTTDEAELKFQQAEEARDKAGGDEARQAAVELYREALKLRPAFPAADVGLARLLMDLNEG